MATNVQFLRDIKEDIESSWSGYCHDNKLSEHILACRYSEHDKEMLKRMMLEHEAIFRKQVYELHRLYKIQKDLMTEIQTIGFYGSPIPAEPSHSNSLYQMRSGCTEKMSQLLHLPVGNISYGKTTFAGTERPHFSFTREGSVQSAQSPLVSGAPRKDTMVLDYNPQKRRLLDYIDIEVTDGSGKMNIAKPSYSASVIKNGTCSLYSENDVKLTLGSSHREGRQFSNLSTQASVSACSTVDLNKPKTGICCESPSHSASVQLFGLKIQIEHNQGNYSSMRSNTDFADRHYDQQTTSDLLHANVQTKREWPFFNHISGKKRSTVDFFAQTSYSDGVPTSSETLQLNIKKCHENFPFHHNKPETWSGQEPTHKILTSERVPHFMCSNSGLMAPSMPSSVTTHQADLTSCASSFVSSWRKPATSISHMPIAVQALPCFNGSSNLSNESLISKTDAQIPVTATGNWQSSRNITTSLGSVIVVSHANGVHHGFHLDSYSALCPASGNPNQIENSNVNLDEHLPGNFVKGFLNRDLKTPVKTNLNQVIPSAIEDSSTTRRETVIDDVESKYDNLSGVPSWLRKKVSSIKSVDLKKHASKFDFSFSNGHCPLLSSFNVVSPEIERKEERELDFSLCNLQEVSTSQFKDHKMQGNEVSDNNGERILRFPIPCTIQQSSNAVSIGHMEKHLTGNFKFTKNDNMTFTDLACDTEVLNSQKKIHIGDSSTEICGGKGSAIYRNHINLNAEFACTDDPMSSEILSHDEIVVQSSHSVPIFDAKNASTIDLEGYISQAETSILNQHKCIPSSKKDGSEENDCSSDTFIRLAAENLVAMPMNCNGHSDEINSHLLSQPRFDTLCWFAELVSCSEENPKLLANGGIASIESSDDDGMDHFEAMTLKLHEIRLDQYQSKANELESKDENEGKDDTGAASLLFTKPRCGQSRKRRQRRDFQKDILPGLASLSRHEVTEDLRTIGGMMKALGRPWQTGLTRRNMGRNGMTSRAKGRRQLRNLPITTEEIKVGPPSRAQPSNSEIGVDGRIMIGWGRTTRRCHRQRCLPRSLSAPLTLKGAPSL